MCHLSPVSCLNTPSHTQFRSLIVTQSRLVSVVVWQTTPVSDSDVIHIHTNSTQGSVLIIVITVVCVLMPTGSNSGSVEYSVTH